MAIGSSSKNAKLILERVGLYDVFDFISDGNGITKSKPDPEVFLNAVKGLKLQPNDCLVVEDAVAGIEAAKAGGFTAIAIGDAHSCLKSDYKIKKLSDVLEIASNCQQ